MENDIENEIMNFIVEECDHNLRIDKFIAENQSDLSRSYIQKLIKDEAVQVNNHSIKSNYKVSKGDIIQIVLPEPIMLDIKPEDIPLDVIYEDDDIILINKRKGKVVHPAAGHCTGTLVNALLFHCNGNLSGINGVLRPGIVHRIDRDTTGVIVACKNDKSHSFISEQLKVHSITRKYNAIVYQNMKEPTGTVIAPIGRHPNDRKKMAINYKNGKTATTHYALIDNLGKGYAHIQCTLETGRTHQIRVHMASIHHPLVGDQVYGPSKSTFKLEGQALHASVLGFIHPTTKEYVEFVAPLPSYFNELLEKLNS